jgi:uncharacterized protein
MAYAPSHRAFYDADSHIMELPDFLKRYADPHLRELIPEVDYRASLVTDEEVAVIVAQGGRHSPEHVAAQIALGDRLIESSKEIQALGAFDGADRSRALDLLGFKRQLVFATHSVAMPFSPSSKITPELRYGAARAHNRHMADFCAADDRLLGVAIVPLDEPSGCRTGRLPNALPATSTSTPSGRGWRKAARPSCCTWAARRCSRPAPG